MKRDRRPVSSNELLLDGESLSPGRDFKEVFESFFHAAPLRKIRGGCGQGAQTARPGRNRRPPAGRRRLSLVEYPFEVQPARQERDKRVRRPKRIEYAVQPGEQRLRRFVQSRHGLQDRRQRIALTNSAPNNSRQKPFDLATFHLRSQPRCRARPNRRATCRESSRSS